MSKLAHSKGFASNKKFILTTRRDRFRLEGAFVEFFRFGIKNLVIKASSLLSTMKWRLPVFISLESVLTLRRSSGSQIFETLLGIRMNRNFAKL